MAHEDHHSGTARWISIVIMVIGAIMVIAGAVTYGTVSSTLKDENITVAEDATCLAGQPVAGPFAAFCQAEIIAHHSLEATGGKTYAELGRDDPLRDVAMNGSFLRASLFTSVVAFGVAVMAIFIGIVFVLIGVAILNLSNRAGAAKAA
jgi:ABC-type sugar transport system permease subunit